MSEMSLLPAPRLSADVEPRLIELAEHRMLAPARRAGYELRLVGATVLPQRQVIARTEWGTWLFVDHVEDPTAQQYRGKIPVPAEHHARLTEMDRYGVSPDLIWLAHQQHEDWQEGDRVVVPAPRHLREKDERLKVQMATGTNWFLKAAGAVVVAAAALPLSVVGAIAGAGVGLDPLVLGGVKHPELPVVEWVVLAQWEWE
jgi:hypothetical protein